MDDDRKHLLIPIHVDALVVGRKNSAPSPLHPSTVSAAPQYPRLKVSYEIGTELRRPKARLTPALEPGIHLHFRLPSVVAHGDLKSEHPFPRIPNRWLVQRYYKEEQGDKLRVKAWLVFSDKKAEDSASAVELLIAPPAGRSPDDAYQAPFSFRPTGEARVIWDELSPVARYDFTSDHAENDEDLDLTAVTGGDAGFSAHYPACRSILGFHDKLDDLDKAAFDPEPLLSYLVTGWYSSTKHDPWNDFVTNKLPEEKPAERPKAIQHWMEEHGCSIDLGNGELPAGILCHGIVKELRRQKDGSAQTVHPDPFESFATPASYWVDLGNTSAEAFAARVAKERNRATHNDDLTSVNLLEDLITALQTGLFSQGSNAAEMDAELHRQGFAALDGGKTWEIQQEATSAQDTVPPSKPTALPPLTADLQKQLDALNVLERDHDRRERLLRDYRWELYALWHRWTAAIRLETQDKLEPNLKVLKAFVDQSQKEEASKKIKLDKAKETLTVKLKDLSTAAGAPIQYRLIDQPAAPFYAPKDPVLLLTGPATEAKGTRLRSDCVKVRVTGQEIQSFRYDLEQEIDQTFTAEMREQWLEKLGLSKYLAAVPPWSARLFKEALLLDEMETIEKPDGKKQKYFNTKVEDGVLPDKIGRFSWKHNPWIPLYLYWEVSWTPDQMGDAGGDLTGEELTDHWTLRHDGGESKPSTYRRNTELLPRSSLPGKGDKSEEDENEEGETVNGLSFVGRPLFDLQYAQAEARQKEKAASPGADNPWKIVKKQLDQSLGRARQSAMISQSLAGLHDALIMRWAGDQLPPLEYKRWEVNELLYLDEIGKVLGEDFHPDSSPTTPVGDPPGFTPPFCPLRTGLLHLQNLWIIDAFGQRVRVEPEKLPSLCQSGRLKAGPSSSESSTSVRLHPRFCRPMRLKFAGISADDSNADAGPVCGWVVPNRFDQNLVLYAANGRPVGILQKRFHVQDSLKRPATLFYWVAVPGSIGVEAMVDGIQNRHLQEFAKFVLSLGSAEGRRFAELINEAMLATEQRVPEDNPLLSVLIGRPLALVRAQLSIELDGLPAFDQKLSWIEDQKSGDSRLADILKTSFESGKCPPPNQFMKTGGVENVRWPVRLGDRRSTNDGLVGFFKDSSEQDGTRPFYQSWGFEFPNPQYPKVIQSEQSLELDCRTALQVTLLMDPQARVHVTSGVLPKGFLELPTEQLKGARQVREVFFQTAPVLGTPNTPHVPKPSDDYGQWSWAYRPNVTGWAEDPEMVSAAELSGPAVGWPALTEGWLKLKIEPVLIRSLWMKAPVTKPRKNTCITLAWSLHGADADSVQVFLLRDGKEIPQSRPLGLEWKGNVEASSTFRIRASNQAGYEDSRDIDIQVED